MGIDPALSELLRADTERDDQEIEAIIRLRSADVEVPGVRLVARFGQIATCGLRTSWIRRVRRDENVLSLKAARPLGAEAPGPPARLPLDLLPADARRPQAGGGELTGAGVVVGFVDYGCDIDDPNFKHPDGTTRLEALWDQRTSGPGPAPQPYGYGSAYSRAQIDAALRSGDPYDALGYHHADADRDGSGTHGNHCMDIAAGNGRGGGPIGVAPDAKLMFVHLANRGTGGLANLGDSRRLLDGVHYIACMAGARPWVINLSIGACGGPHDGWSLVEMALDELLSAAPGRCIVQSAGNYYDKSTHASGRLEVGEFRSLTVITDEADRTANEVEVWYRGKDEFRVMVESPTGARSQWVLLGGQAEVLEGDELVGRIYHRDCDPNNEDNQLEIFLYPWAPAGPWIVTLHALTARNGVFHAWIERDEACEECQARFDPADADSSCTTGTIANGHLPLVVGAYDAHAPTRAPTGFSSAGPTRDGRPGPDVLAPGAQVLAARSAPHGASASPGMQTRMSGTSMATPHVTGLVALCLEGAGRPLAIEEIRALLLSTAQPDTSGPTPSPRSGWGWLDIPEAVRTLSAVGPRASPLQFVSAHTTTKQRDRDEKATMTPDFEQAEQLSFDPDAVYRTIAYRRAGPVAAWIDDTHTVVARPGEAPSTPPAAGDVLVSVALGEPGLGRAAVLTGAAMSTRTALAGTPVSMERGGPGAYAVVVDRCTGASETPERVARLILNDEGVVPPGRLLLRSKRITSTNGDTALAEDDESGPPATQARPAAAAGLSASVVAALSQTKLSCKIPEPPPPEQKPPRRAAPSWRIDFVRPDDPRPDNGVDAARAPGANVKWWLALGLEAVRPLRDLDPSRQQWAYANRVHAVQRLLAGHVGNLRVSAVKRIAPDGILGPSTYLALFALARRTDLGTFRPTVAAFGFDMDALLTAPARVAAGAARWHVAPGQVVDRLAVTAEGGKFLDFYELHKARYEEADRRMDTYLSAWLGKLPPDLDWPMRIRLLRALYGARPVEIQAALVRADRNLTPDDAHRLVPQAGIGFAWTASEEGTPQGGSVDVRKERPFRPSVLPTEPKALGIDFSARPRARAAIAAAARGPGAHKLTTLLKSIHPKPDADGLVAAQMVLDAKKTEDRENAEKAIAAVLEALTRRRDLPEYLERLHRERKVESTLARFVKAHAVVFEYGLDALKARGEFDFLFKAVGDFRSHIRRELLARLVKRAAKYADDPTVKRFLEQHRLRTAAEQRHGYDEKSGQIRLEKGHGTVPANGVYDEKSGQIRLKKGHGTVPANGVVADVNPRYQFDKFDSDITRIRPERIDALCERWMDETALALDALVAEPSAGERSTEDLMRETFASAVDNLTPRLSESDVQQGELRISLRVDAIRVEDDTATGTRYQILSAAVEKCGDEPWRPTETPRWRRQDEFEEELDWFEFSATMKTTAAIVKVIAIVTGGVAGALWLTAGGGAAALLNLARGTGNVLVRAAGGRAVLASNIVISEVLMVVTKRVHGEEITPGDYVGAAFDGYLGAIGFRVVSPVGVGAAKLIPNALRNRVTTWVAGNLTREVAAGAVTGPASLFARDLVHVMRHGGSLSSWEAHLDAGAQGGCDGATLGLLGNTGPKGAVAAAILGVARAGPCGGTPAQPPPTEAGGRPRGGPRPPRASATQTVAKRTAELIQGYRPPGASTAATGLRTSSVTAYATAALSGADSRLADVLANTERGRSARANAIQVLTKRMEGIVKSLPGGEAQTVVLELGKVPLSDQAVKGIERLLTHRADLPKGQLDALVRSLVGRPKAADGILSLLGAVDAPTFKKLHTPDSLARLVGSDAIHKALDAGPDTIAFALARDFNGSATKLDVWARELGALDPKLQSEVFDVIRAHGAFLLPSTAVTLAKAGVPFTPELRVGIERLAAVVGTDPVNALLARTPPRISELAAFAAKAGYADLPALSSIVKDPDRAVRLLGEGRTVDDLVQAERIALPLTKADEIALRQGEIAAFEGELARLRREFADAETRLRKEKESPELTARERRLRLAAERAPADKAAAARAEHEAAKEALDALTDAPVALKKDIADTEKLLREAQTKLKAAVAPPPRPPTSPIPAVLRQRVMAFQNRFPKVDRSPASTDALTELFRRTGTTGSTYVPTQTRAAAAELKTIEELASPSRPEVTRIELIKSGPGSRSPDIVIDVQAPDGTVTRSRVEVTTVTGGGAGYQPHGGAAKNPTTPGGIANAVREKIRSTQAEPSQLVVPMPSGVPPGGTLAVHLPFAAQAGTVDVSKQIAGAMALLKGNLADKPYVHAIEFYAPGKPPARYVRQPDGTYAAPATPAPATPAPPAPESDAEDAPSLAGGGRPLPRHGDRSRSGGYAWGRMGPPVAEG